MITVTRKHNIFKQDHTHTHLVFKDGVQIGEISKHANRWHLKSLEGNQEPIYVEVNDHNKNTYEKLADGITSALNRWNKADAKTRQAMTVCSEAKNNRGNTMLGLRERTCKEVIHIPSGTVYKNVTDAAKDKNIKLFSLKTWLSKKQNLLVWAYYDATKHNATTFFNQ